MHSNRWRSVVLTAFVAIVLAAAGCTGTEVLVTTQETLNVEIQLVNTDTRFESASFRVFRIALRPLDTNADAALQADGIGALRSALVLSYANDTPATTSVSLSTGVYQVTLMILQGIAYGDLDPPNPAAQTCQEYVTRWDQPSTELMVTDWGGDALVTVESGVENQLTLVVDGQALENAFLNSWTCRQTWSCQPYALWCLGQFQPSVFLAQTADFLEFQ